MSRRLADGGRARMVMLPVLLCLAAMTAQAEPRIGFLEPQPTGSGGTLRWKLAPLATGWATASRASQPQTAASP